MFQGRHAGYVGLVAAPNPTGFLPRRYDSSMILTTMGFLRWNEPVLPHRAIRAAAFISIITLGAVLRFHGLGQRSLWGDELSTWKVAEMPVGESLRWQPELTKPPLYQFAVRAIWALSESGAQKSKGSTGLASEGSGEQKFHGSRVPSEWHLRLPAAICGALIVAAMWWLGSLAGGWTLGAAGALLLAVNELQLDYSQEARPYSMLVLGSILSTGIWHELLVRHEGTEARRHEDGGRRSTTKRNRWSCAVGYVVVTALAFHANYLMALTVAGQVIWGSLVVGGRQSNSNSRFQFRDLAVPVGVLLAAAVLCLPMVWHFLRHRTSVFQGLDWIAPPTIDSSVHVLSEITFGLLWVPGLFVPAMIAWILFENMELQSKKALASESQRREFSDVSQGYMWVLLVVWLGTAWGGLLLISWIAHPAMVARYALPAAVPAILLPLIVLHRFDRRLPLLVAVLFVLGTAPGWIGRGDRVQPGFREMVAFLDEYADPQREAVVAVVERTTSPGWEEMDLLGFEYYQSSKFEIRNSKKGESNFTSPRHHVATSPHRAAIEVLYLRNARPDGDQPILRDPRALWLVTFLADPTEALKSAARRVEQIEIDDKVFDQLYFEPYRLIRVAPIPQ